MVLLVSKEQYLLTDIPPALIDKLVKEAETRDTSIANIVSGVLAHDLGVEFTPSDRHLRPEMKGEVYIRPSGQNIGVTMNLRLPSTVMKAWRQEEALSGLTMRAIVLTALSDAFDLDPPETKTLSGKRPGRPRQKASK